MISEILKIRCQQLLTREDIIAIAAKHNLSYGYINDIKNRLRYREDVENDLRSYVKKRIAKLSKEEF